MQIWWASFKFYTPPPNKTSSKHIWVNVIKLTKDQRYKYITEISTITVIFKYSQATNGNQTQHTTGVSSITKVKAKNALKNRVKGTKVSYLEMAFKITELVKRWPRQRHKDLNLAWQAVSWAQNGHGETGESWLERDWGLQKGFYHWWGQLYRRQFLFKILLLDLPLTHSTLNNILPFKSSPSPGQSLSPYNLQLFINCFSTVSQAPVIGPSSFLWAEEYAASWVELQIHRCPN